MTFYRWGFITNNFLMFFLRFLQIFFVEKIDNNKKKFFLDFWLGFTLDFFMIWGPPNGGNLEVKIWGLFFLFLPWRPVMVFKQSNIDKEYLYDIN